MMFAIRLKKMIEDSGMSRDEISKKAQISKWSISQFVNGHGIPKRDTVERLAAALDCNVEYLMGTSNVVRYAKEEKITPKNAEGYSDPTAYKALKSIEREEKMEFKRGEIYEYELTNGQGTKYAVVVAADERSADRYISVVMLNEKAYGNYSVAVVAHSLMYAECDRVSFAMSERLSNYIRTATAEEMKEVDRALLSALGIEAKTSESDESLADELENTRAELADAEKIIAEERTSYHKLLSELQSARSDAEEYKRTIKNLKAKESACMLHHDGSAEVVFPSNIEFERDFFKAQYEALLTKILERAV